MATIHITRPGERDAFGDQTEPTTPPQTITGARIAWSSATLDADRKTVVTTRPTIYIKRQEPDVQTGDVITTPFSRTLTVIDVQPWEHPRHENAIMGVAIICEEVR